MPADTSTVPVKPELSPVEFNTPVPCLLSVPLPDTFVIISLSLVFTVYSNVPFSLISVLPPT